jgi:hypothetical protein
MSWGVFFGIVGGLGIVFIWLVVISVCRSSANADESCLRKGIKHLRLAMNLLEKDLEQNDWDDLDNLIVKLETKELTKNGELN